jgi:hypothetical protein
MRLAARPYFGSEELDLDVGLKLPAHVAVAAEFHDELGKEIMSLRGWMNEMLLNNIEYSLRSSYYVLDTSDLILRPGFVRLPPNKYIL